MAKLIAAHLKKPMLSRTIDITIVDRIVTEAPLTVSKMEETSENGTIPSNNRTLAAIEAGIDSLTPNGLHIIKQTVRTKIATVKRAIALLIGLRHTFYGFVRKVMVKQILPTGY
jgi:hypothetical protein